MSVVLQMIVLVAVLIMPVAQAHETEVDQDTLMTRPDAVDEITTVHIGIYVLDIDKISAADQGFVANIVVALKWHDPRAVAKGQKRRRRKPLQDVWYPNIIITNMQKVFLGLPQTVEIYEDGTVYYRQRYFGNFSNKMNLTKFPFDKHTLRITFVTPGYDQEKIVFSNEGFEKVTTINSNLTVAEWDIENWRGYPEPYEAVEGLLKLPGFVFEFEVKRHSGYYLLKVLIPLTMIIVMSWLVFWIDPTQFGAQMGLSATAMLTLIAYRFTLETLIPRISYMTILDSFLIGATFLVFGALVEVVLSSALAIHNRIGLARRIDRWARFCFPASFVLLLLGLTYQVLLT